MHFFTALKSLQRRRWQCAENNHKLKAKTHNDFIQMVIDWECARYTKPDKPLNARETLYKYYPNLKSKVLPILKELNL